MIIKFRILLFFFILLIHQVSFANSNHYPSRNPGTIDIQNLDSYDRVFAMSDVHGMYPAVVKLLTAANLIDSNQNWIGKKDLFIVIGDSIDKGMQSIDVLNLWIKLQTQLASTGGTLIHVLGNHEAELLADPTSTHKTKELRKELKQKRLTIEHLVEAKYPLGKFMRSMPLAARVGSWLFCHSGFYPDLAWQEFEQKASNLLGAGRYAHPFIIGDSSILELKDWEKDPTTREQLFSSLDKNQIRGVVFGHQPKALRISGENGISRNGRLIKIDNGMAPEAGEDNGSILVFSTPTEMYNYLKTPLVQSINSKGNLIPLKVEKER